MFDQPAFRLYPIVDPDVCERRGYDPRAVAAACVRAGARVLQLRVKSGASRAFLALADDVAAVAREHGAALIVNDRPDVARMCGAAGVHVGQDDLPVDAVRHVLGDGVVGLSTHDPAQVDAALASDADYIAVGPIFDTATKTTGYSARGLELVKYAAGRGKAVVAIGGIDLDRAPEVVQAGAASVAVISDLLVGRVEDRVRQYLHALA